MEMIETNRFILRKIAKEDAKDIFEILNKDDVIKTLNMKKLEKIEDANLLIEEYLTEYEKGNKEPFVIMDKENNELLGVFLLKVDLYNEDAFEFTVFIKPEFWGKGIYTEVLPYMIEEALEKIKVKNFRGYIKEGNIASEKVLEKNKFKLEKIFKVENIEERIKSYLITQEMYEKIKNDIL